MNTIELYQKKKMTKCKKDSNVFKGLYNINEMIGYVLQFKGEPKKLKKNC